MNETKCCFAGLSRWLFVLIAVAGLTAAAFSSPADQSGDKSSSAAKSVSTLSDRAPSGFVAKALAGGRVMLSWGMPKSFVDAGLVDSPAEKLDLSDMESTEADLETPRVATEAKGYPLTEGNRTLLGYRVLRDGQVISDLVQKRYFIAEGPGRYAVESVYEGRAGEPSDPQEFVPPDATISCTCDITDIDISNYPRVTIRYTSSLQNAPLSAFHVEEEGEEMDLLSSCFSSGANGVVDVALVVDRSCGMNDYICDLAYALDCIQDYMPSCLDVKFALVFYGKNADGNSTCGAVYNGSPKHEDPSTLRSMQSAIDRLYEVSGYSSTGNKEPAYDAIDCAANATPWRTGSQRVMILVSDENNDHCSQDGIPQTHSVASLTTSLNNRGVKFYAWTRYSVLADCYDYCTNRPSCSNWYYSGFNSGYQDFNPLAVNTNGGIENICNSIWDLFDQIDLLDDCGGYTLCYDAPCCVPGDSRSISVRISYNGETCTDWGSYCQYSCGSSHTPWLNCWTGNPTGFTPGDPVTVCVNAGDADGNLESVTAHYSFGGCNETVNATNVSGDRWCVTIPGGCTNASGDLTVHFTARDACGSCESEACVIPNQTCVPPEIACWPGNPDNYNPGEPVTVCAVIRCDDDDHCGDDDNGDENGDGESDDDDDDSCNGHEGGWGCWRDGGGDWHDRHCNGDHHDRHCDGDSNDDGDWRDGGWNWHDRHCDGDHEDHGCNGYQGGDNCWRGGDGRWHEGDCDGDHDEHDGEDCPEITTVTATYTVGGCNFTGEATRCDGNRYCVTIPAECANCDDIVVRFVAVNECGGQDEVTCTVTCDTCVIHVGDYRTQTQGGWGQNSCSGNNVRCFLNQWFPTCFPTGITVGGNFTARFTSASAIGAYLPRGTTPGVLTQNHTNPTSTTSAGVFLSQVLSLGLNIGFSDCGASGFGMDLGPLEVISGPFAGWTVDEIYALANTVLGGNLAALPAGKTLSDLNNIVDAINNNFDNGTQDCQTLRKICEPGNCPPPDVTCWESNPARFLRGSLVNIFATVSVDPGREYTIAGRYSTFACSSPFAPVLVAPDRWCITIPANCTYDEANISATFYVTTDCGIDSVTCTIPPCIGLVVHGAPENPTHFQWGQPVTLCATVSDADGDIDPNSLVGHYWTEGGCNETVHGTLVDGRYCITVPGNCLRTCNDLYVEFMADDICGAWDRDTVIVHSTNNPPVVTCFTGNPGSYVRGQPLTMCATVVDPENNVTGVTGSFNTGAGCNQTLPATFADGRWCITIPATCTQTCEPIVVNFIATDACGRTGTVACTAAGPTAPPQVACYTGGGTNYLWGSALTACVTVTDPNNDVTGVTMTYNTGDGCSATVPATFGSGRWCAQIPANCTRVCGPISVTFTATDACGHTGTTGCSYTMTPRAPVVDCFTGNPPTYVYGQATTVCATVTDPDNNVSSVTGQYLIGTCNTTVPATLTEGRWCITVPANCMQNCGQLRVRFLATDACGLTDFDTCRVNSAGVPPVVNCYTGGGTQYLWGSPITACVTVTDPDNDVTGVMASFNTGPGCNQTVPAVFAEGRWCVVIPANCTRVCGPIVVNFTATDACGRTGTASCTYTMVPRPPDVTCYPGNPQTYQYGIATTVCANVTDPDNNITSVTGQYMIGTCNTTVPATQVEGRWCITVPANCMQSCGQLRVRFLATDACGLTDFDTCRVNGSGVPPQVNCFTGFPTTYYWGDAITACVIVNDPDNDVTGVTASYNTGPGCVFNGPATFSDGRWCVVIPGNCTRVCGPIQVTFTATDACGRTGSTVCNYTNIPRLPVVDCWPGNPAQYIYNQPLSMCALVNDLDNNVTGVTARFLSAGCDVTIPAVFAAGRWCATIGPNCTSGCSNIWVIFTATDACGGVEDDTCTVTPANQPPTVLCLSDRDGAYHYGLPFEACAIVGDPDNDIVSVTATYTGSTCNTTVPANPMGSGVYCVTVPGSCTQSYNTLWVVFTVTDHCGRVDTDSCEFINESLPPDVQCWSGNPNSYLFGTSVEMCAVASDPDNDIASITGFVSGGSCTQSFPALPVGGGRYCFTIPASCTQSFTMINVKFVVIDGAGNRDSVNCPMNSGSTPCQPAQITCWSQNPTQFVWGQPLMLCAVVVDPDTGVTSVDAHIQTEICDQYVAAASMGNGRWCVSIPGSCTQTLQPISVTFLASDDCPPVQIQTTCGATLRCTAPTIVCTESNPTEFQFGAPLTMCATVFDADADVVSVTAHYVTPLCDETVPAVSDGSGHMCVTVPGSCLETDQPLTVTFRATDRCGLYAEVTCTATPPPPLDECCYFCYVENPITYRSQPIAMEDLHQVAKIQNNNLWLYWNEVPAATFYQIYCTDQAQDPAMYKTVAFIGDNLTTAWRNSSPLNTLPASCYFNVAAMTVIQTQLPGDCDIARWEFNTCANDVVPDFSGNLHDAIAWYLCPPNCDTETDPGCNDQQTGYGHFEGYVGSPPNRCEEHYRVANDSIFYADRFQVWARIRLAQHPTIETGPFYIMGNASNDVVGGGWALRVDVGFFMVNGQREYHNRLTGLVWDENLNDDGGWWTLQSPAPNVNNPDRWSVPVGEWACICMVVDGNQSMLLINGVVVAAGDMTLFSHNNAVPLIIGAGYRHNTQPIEYPFRGDMDCIRLTDLDCAVQ